MARAFCIVNPVHRRSERAWKLVQQHCDALGFPPPIRLNTTRNDPGEGQAREAIDADADLVIVIGGDGTVRNVSNVIAGTDVSLAVIPTGTANIVHLNVIGRQRRLDQAVRTALLGQDARVDTGMVELTFADGREPLRGRFLVVVGVGHDVTSIAEMSPWLKQRLGALAYYLAGLRHIARSPVAMQLAIDGVAPRVTSAWSTLVANCGQVPGGVTVVPDADPADGMLNVLQIVPRSIASWLPIAWRSWRGSHRLLGTMPEQPAQEVTMIPEHFADVQIDGDVWHNVERVHIVLEPASLLIRGHTLPLAQPDDTVESEYP